MGWDILSWSYSVVRKDLKLLLFPLFSGGAAAVAGCLFVLMHHFNYLALFAWYVAATFLMIFGNCALAACALAHFSGEQPSLGYGFEKAGSHAGEILLWSVLSSTVGVALRAIERRASIAGQIAVWLFGAAWGMATFFVVPVLVAEGVGPIEALKRSSALLRDSWRDQLVARVRLGWFGLLLFAPALLLGMAGAIANPLFLAAALLYGVLVAAFVTAAQGIFQAALYRQLTTGQAPAGLPNVLTYRSSTILGAR
jgi:Family of unknown function (DUF6159)